MKYIKRHAVKTIEKMAGAFPAVLLTGARQTGKITLLKKLTAEKNIAGITFDDPAEEESAKSDPKMFLEFHPSPFMFDEVQYVPELFRYLKIQIDQNRSNGMYFLTGSSQLQLMQSATESLSGRIGIIQLYPLSEREKRGDDFDGPFIPAKERIIERNSALKDFTFSQTDVWNSIFTGGYPEVVKGTVSPADFYSNYLKTYIERDIRKLANIADEMQFLQFITVAASRTGQLVNYSDIAKETGISEVTAKKWLSLLVTSGLVYLLPPFSANVEKRVVKTPKLYFMDTGLAAYLTKWTSAGTIRNGAIAGAFFETYVISEIIKSFSNQGLEPPLYFYRDKDKIEIDLLIYLDNTLYPVEIKKTASPNKNDARNFFITERIKSINIASPCVVCNCEKPVLIAPGTLAVPVRFI